METTNHLIATARDLLHQDWLEPVLKPMALLSMDIIDKSLLFCWLRLRKRVLYVKEVYYNVVVPASLSRRLTFGERCLYSWL